MAAAVAKNDPLPPILNRVNINTKRKEILA